MRADILRLHHFEPSSRANGPGERAVVWVQGCALGCQGCFNPGTHDFHGGEKRFVVDLASEIIQLKDKIEGLTISGGEPVHQRRAVANLIQKVRAETNLSILVFSGYEMEELRRLPEIEPFLEGIDVLIAGRYDASRRVARGLAGSANKVFYFFTNRYSPKDLEDIPQAEILIQPGGEIVLSGIDPLAWNPGVGNQ